MYKTFKKEDKIQSFRVENDKVFTVIVIEETSIINPTLEQFYSIGWEDYEIPEPEPYIPTLEELVEDTIRNGLEGETLSYTANQEFHLNRMMLNPNRTEDDVAKWTEYNSFVERCIAWAKTQPHRDI